LTGLSFRNSVGAIKDFTAVARRNHTDIANDAIDRVFTSRNTSASRIVSVGITHLAGIGTGNIQAIIGNFCHIGIEGKGSREGINNITARLSDILVEEAGKGTRSSSQIKVIAKASKVLMCA
jgi:hypothetical protein